MSFDVQKALREIDDLAPIYRREFAMKYVRKHLDLAEAKKILLKKDKFGYFQRMVDAGYTDYDDTLKRIGKERVLEFFKIYDRKV